MNLVKYKNQEEEEKPEKDTRPKTINPWFLETVQNGLKATNVKESSIGITENKKIPTQYFEYDRIFGQGAFESALKVPEMFSELQNITPKTKGFIFGRHNYFYHGNGILRIGHNAGKEAFFSDDTLRNESVACYLSLVYSREEDRIESLINELDDATDGHQTDNTRRRISYQDPE